MPMALWRCGQAKCSPHQVGEGECPAVLRLFRYGTAGHSGRRSAAVGSAGVLRTEGDRERSGRGVVVRFIVDNSADVGAVRS
jgi:hypothetical protein